MLTKRVKKAPKATLNTLHDDKAVYSPTPLSLPLYCLPSLGAPALDEPVPTIEPMADPTTDALIIDALTTNALTTKPTIELMTKLTTKPTTELTRPTTELVNDTKEKATILK